ncbi:MAG: XRE family transcriptional regulator [Muribaculaceae bacterium]|nr:XRE family transcriptional regulator [Muribaculaceae bacterium]
MHIGQRIHDVMKEQGRTSVWLAEQLNTVRTNVYDIYHRSHIDTELLLRISNLLNHNFAQEIADEYSSQLQNKHKRSK